MFLLREIEIGSGALLVAAAVFYFAGRKINAVVPVGAFNLTSPNNLAYSGVNAIGASMTGDKDWSLGVKIYEWTHPAAMEMEAQITKPVPIKPVPSRSLPADAWSPWNPN